MAKKRTRGNGEGSIYRRSDGRWCAAYYEETQSGRKRRVLYGPTRAGVATRLTEALASSSPPPDASHEGPSARATVEQVLRAWLDAKAVELASSTVASYRQVVAAHLSPALGSMLLSEIDPSEVRSILADLQDRGRAPRTVQYVHGVLHRALNWAVAEGSFGLGENPASRVRPPAPPRHEPETLTPEEVGAVLEAAAGHPHRGLVVVAASTGLRQGELLGLQTRDLVGRRVLVRRTLRRTGELAPPKSSAGRRSVPLTVSASQALERATQGRPEKAFVFHREDAPLNYRSVTRGWHRMQRFAGVARASGRGHPFHSLRRFYASQLAMAGVPPRVAQRLLGHSSIRLTMDIYAAVDDEALDKALELVSSRLP